MRIKASSSLGLASFCNITDNTKGINSVRKVRRLRTLVCNVARQIQLEGIQGFRTRAAFITLTYRTAEDYKPGHIGAIMDNYRLWMKRRGVKFWSGLWVAEMQKRGVIHYHLLIWLPDKGLMAG